MNSYLNHSVKRLFAVGEQKRSGLILCKSYYAEFAGPGAAIGNLTSQEYVAVIAIGAPEIEEMMTHEDRQKAYSRRIQWIRWLNKIVSGESSVERVEQLFSGFGEFFGNEILAEIPDEVLALLASVLPQTICSFRSQNPGFGTPKSLTELYNSGSSNVSIITLKKQESPFLIKPQFSGLSNTPDVLSVLPCSA